MFLTRKRAQKEIERDRILTHRPHPPRPRFAANGLLRGRVTQPLDLIAYADQKHRLPRILQQINNPVLLVFQLDRLAIGQ
jgi:hypothetical protein